MRMSPIFISFQFPKLLDAAALHVGADKLFPTVNSIGPEFWLHTRLTIL
jgi:hypothetical protein